jgi:hypothetical protein
MRLVVFNEDAIDDQDVYKATFFAEPSEDGQLYQTSGYMLENVNTGQVLIDSTAFAATSKSVDGVGFFMEFENDAEVEVIPERTGYVGTSDGENAFSLDPRTLDDATSNWVADVQEGTSEDYAASPFDYELRWVSPDDSLYQPPRFRIGAFLREEIPVFAVNTTTNRLADLLIEDLNDNGTFDVADALILNEEVDGERLFRYRIDFRVPSDAPSDPPQAGDRLRISVERPFATGDFFQFTVRSSSFDEEVARNELDDVKVVPNPYIASAKWERASPQITGRGERKIYFTHLPAQCTVRIFNLRGELIRELEHDGMLDDGQLSWNLRTEGNQDVAFGMYIYHIDAPGIGEKTGKFAIIK